MRLIPEVQNLDQLRLYVNEILSEINTEFQQVFAEGMKLSGNIDMQGFKIINVPYPTNPKDALTQEYLESIDPVLHAATHEDGGVDEIGVNGLSGLLADLQSPLDHTHQSSGSGVGGKLDHGLAMSAASLLDNDHTQYLNAVSDTSSLDLTLTGQSISGVVLPAGIDHGGLSGLGDDDHTQYALLDGTNQPFTGDIEISKAVPEIRLTDTGDSNYARLVRTDTSAQMNLYNKMLKPGPAIGNALNFDGINERVNIGATGINTPTAFTISLWAKRGAVPGGTFMSLFSGANDKKNSLWVYPDGDFGFGDGASNPTWERLDCNCWTDQTAFHHIVVTVDNVGAASTAEIWFDGVSQGTLTSSFITYNDWSNFVIADWSNQAGFEFLGAIDEFAMWSEKLSDNDIADLYALGVALRIDRNNNWPTDGGSIGTNLELLFHFDQSSGTNVPDESGNGRDGTTANMEDADWIPGKVSPLGADVEVSIIQAEDSARGGVAGKITLGQDGVDPPELVYDGYDQTWKIQGVQVMDLDNNGTLTINNGLSTAQALKLKNAAAQSGNIFEHLESDDSILVYLEEDGELVFNQDNKGIWFGAGQDSSIIFNGSGMVIQSDSVTATDYLQIRGGTNGIDFNIGATEQITLTDGKLVPTTTNDIDFGDSTHLFKDIWELGKHYFRDSAIGVYSQADTFLDLFADGAVRIGNSSAGAPTTYLSFSSGGDLTFVGTGSGLNYGSMYSISDMAITLTTQSVWYEIDAAAAWVTGQLNGATFTDPYITITNAGTYLITWNITSRVDTANQVVEAGIMIDQTATDNPSHGLAGVQGEGRSGVEFLNATRRLGTGGSAILTLAASKKISLAVRNITSAGKVLTVGKGNLKVIQIGG